MPTVTDVTQQRRRQSRVNVFLDDEFWCGMSRLCALELDLTPGRELSKDDVTAAQTHIAENEALGWAVERLAERPRTRHQIAEKLRGKEYAEEVVQAVIAKCEELLLLNDRMYATDLAAGRLLAGQGRRKVAERLRQDGVERELAEEVLDQTFLPEDEAEQAEAALLRKYEPPLLRDDQRRAMGYLTRRGFSAGAARDAIANHGATADEEAEASPSVEEAVEMLQRKYRTLNPRDGRDRARAQAFLVRRGCTFDIVREALNQLR